MKTSNLVALHSLERLLRHLSAIAELLVVTDVHIASGKYDSL